MLSISLLRVRFYVRPSVSAAYCRRPIVNTYLAHTLSPPHAFNKKEMNQQKKNPAKRKNHRTYHRSGQVNQPIRPPLIAARHAIWISLGAGQPINRRETENLCVTWNEVI